MKRRIFLAALTVCLLGAFIFSSPAGASLKALIGSLTSKGALAQGSSVKEEIEAELITLRPFGFEPAEIRRPSGQFVLMIDHRSHLGDVSLQLLRVQGANRLKEKDVPMSRRKSNWLDHLNLPPGEYLLTEANHPEFTCRITLTPR